MNTINQDQAFKAAKAMHRGGYGSFAQSIGTAFLDADMHNAGILLQAFNGLFKTVSDNLEQEALQDYMRVLLDHISADSPCSLEHVTTWAKSQGFGGSKMIQALHQLKMDKHINIDDENTVELI
jgi:hypothetical protein